MKCASNNGFIVYNYTMTPGILIEKVIVSSAFPVIAILRFRPGLADSQT